MDTIEQHNITCIDIDDTLVYWNKLGDGTRMEVAIDTPWDTVEHLEVNTKMLDNIDQLAIRGFYIILWSQSGAAWCETVAKALHIENKISLCMTKPGFYYDDLPAEAWMRRIIP